MNKIFYFVGFFICISTMATASPLESKYQKMLEQMVNINSGTGNFEGARKLRSMIKKELAAYGFKEQIKGDPKGHQVSIYDRNPNSRKTVLLYGHIDTVFSKEHAFQKIKIEGDKMYGPGVIDMKGGVVMILNLIDRLKKQPQMLDQIRVLICDDEETISSFGTPLIDEFGKGIPYGLIFEPGLKNGAVVTSHAGVHWIELSVKGKSSHAGLAHKEGVNACVELGEKIYQISKLTDYKKGFTVSPDIIKGGDKTNIVCDKSSAMIDMRFTKNEDLEKALSQINDLLKNTVSGNEAGDKPTFEIQQKAHFAALETKSTQKLFDLSKAASAQDGVELKGEHVGYGTDGGHLSNGGMEVLVGVGPYGHGIHTDHEYMLISSYEERLKMNLSVLNTILKH